MFKLGSLPSTYSVHLPRSCSRPEFEKDSVFFPEQMTFVEIGLELSLGGDRFFPC